MLNQIKAVLQNKAVKIVESDVYGSTYMVWYGDNGLAVRVFCGAEGVRVRVTKASATVKQWKSVSENIDEVLAYIAGL